MTKTKIIVFVGTVGSGKSTQIKLLSSVLKKTNIKIKNSFLKSGHLFAYGFEVMLVRILFGKIPGEYPTRTLIERRPLLFKNLFSLWLFLDSISISIRFFITIFLPKKLGRTVLVEEYFPGIISDYYYLARNIGVCPGDIQWITNFMIKLKMKGGPIDVVFLNASDSLLKSRWLNRGSFDEKPEYLQMQRTLLKSYSLILADSFTFIDTSNLNKMQTTNSIIKFLKY
jgi:energy-coupling factor transporter ATP-binding protein EcfA2